VTARRKPPANRRLASARPGSRGNAGGDTSAARARLGSRLGSRLAEFAADWGPTAARILLGLVLAWFGYHELIQPTLWTGYVPGVHAASAMAIGLVLAHGWVLLLLAVALIAGIAPRLAAGLAALLLAQIVIWLWASAGLSDLTLRDVGVLGLALCMAGRTEQRLALTTR
jgi:uncharacterized membrane protein YphA (DoxX/SURF4 family)